MECRDCEQLIGERDAAQDAADALANAIASFLGCDVGEHAGGNFTNNPWVNALDALGACVDADGVRSALREAVATTSQKDWAALAGVSPQYVCDALQGRREPGQGICDALGLERVVYYRPKQSK